MNVIPIEGAKKPLFNWAIDLEPNALEQMKRVAKLPFVEHCAIMPDGHLGNSVCVGGVVATRDILVPDFCGVDGGCGVGVVKTSLKKADVMDLETRKRIHHSVCRGIPMGFSHNDQRRIKELQIQLGQKVDYLFEKTGILGQKEFQVLQDVEDAFWSQIGSMGGGNHFGSMDYDENENIWLMIHSGSRNIGKRICDFFNKIGEEQNSKWYSVDTGGISFLPTNSPEGKAYLQWLDFAMRFAFLNRSVMLEEMKKDVRAEFPNVKFEEIINIHHNYTVQESHFGKNVWVHRKGAILAREGVTGIIPGSQGTATYITMGLGNKNALDSSSHGAGRIMGRKAFNEKSNNEQALKAIRDSMEGIVHTKFGNATSKKGDNLHMLDVSEAPAAYKDIEQVMKSQADLVKPIHRLLPLVNWKDVGDE